MGLLVIYMVQFVGLKDLNSIVQKEPFQQMPYVFGLNYIPISNLARGFGLSMDNCDRWFMTDFATNATKQTQDYWGENTGTPWRDDNSTGLISIDNILSSPCNQKEKVVPYFQEWNQFNTEHEFSKWQNVDAFLFKHMENLQHTPIDFVNRTFDDNKDVSALPDGVFKVFEANPKSLHYTFRINDNHIWQYHKNNGLSKITIRSKRVDAQILRIVEGQLETAYMINSAYIKKEYNTTLIAGINYYPFKFDFPALLGRLMNEGVIVVVPVCLCMGFPVFLLAIVTEKERKLVEIMKINGLKMENYWLVTYLFNWVMYLITLVVFIFFGKYVFKF